MNRLAASRPPPLPPPDAVHYPDSDGQPLAESDFQRKPLVYACTALARRYRDRDDVYVSAALFVYYEEGNPRAVVAPDVFVVFGASNHDRRTYKLWEEPKAPDFVLEITSHGTRAEDEGTKRRVYARLGVREYWRFDPTGDWLDPPLKGERLAAGRRYARLPHGASIGTRGPGRRWRTASPSWRHACGPWSPPRRSQKAGNPLPEPAPGPEAASAVVKRADSESSRGWSEPWQGFGNHGGRAWAPEGWRPRCLPVSRPRSAGRRVALRRAIDVRRAGAFRCGRCPLRLDVLVDRRPPPRGSRRYAGLGRRSAS